MTVTSPNNRTTYVGSGNTGPFAIGFDVSSASSFSVTRVIIATGVQTTLTLNALTNGYSLNTALTEITLTESIDSTKRLVFLLDEPITQDDSYLANNTFPSNTVERELDKLTRIALQQQEQIDRSLKFATGSSSSGAQLPDPNTGKAVLWDANGNLINSTDNFNSIATNAAASATAAASSASGAASSASSATSSATSATSSASSASTSATNAATSATAAASSATSASTSATTATTEAGLASTSATNAATSASAASTSATAAAGSATTASTQATNAANSASGAAASNTALKYTFASSTTMADPSSGNVRLDNATVASVTNIAVSANTADSGNPDTSDFIVTWDDSTHSPKGTIMIRKAGTPATYAVFSVTGSITDNGTWLEIPVTYVSGNGTLSAADSLYFGFSRAGNDGAGGDASTNTASSVVGEVALFSDTAGKTLKRATGSGLALLTSGVQSAIAPTANGVMLGNGSSAPTTVAPGSNGNVLTVAGGVWTSAAASSGALTLLQTQTASSSSSIDFSSTYVNSTYKTYIIRIRKLIAATNGVNLQLLVSYSGTYASANYGYSRLSNTISTTTTTGSNSGGAAFILTENKISNDGSLGVLGGDIVIQGTQDSTFASMYSNLLFASTDPQTYHNITGGVRTATTTSADALRLILSSGNITSGTFELYGVS